MAQLDNDPVKKQPTGSPAEPGRMPEHAGADFPGHIRFARLNSCTEVSFRQRVFRLLQQLPEQERAYYARIKNGRLTENPAARAARLHASGAPPSEIELVEDNLKMQDRRDYDVLYRLFVKQQGLKSLSDLVLKDVLSLTAHSSLNGPSGSPDDSVTFLLREPAFHILSDTQQQQLLGLLRKHRSARLLGQVLNTKTADNRALILNTTRAGETLLDRLVKFDAIELHPKLSANKKFIYYRLLLTLVEPQYEAQQGNRGACAAACIQYIMCRTEPATFVETVYGLLSAEQRTSARSRAVYAPENAYERDDSLRNPISRIYQSAALETGNTVLDYRNDLDKHVLQLGVGDWQLEPPALRGGMQSLEIKHMLETQLQRRFDVHYDWGFEWDFGKRIHRLLKQRDELAIVCMPWGSSHHALVFTGSAGGYVYLWDPNGQPEPNHQSPDGIPKVEAAEFNGSTIRMTAAEFERRVDTVVLSAQSEKRPSKAAVADSAPAIANELETTEAQIKKVEAAVKELQGQTSNPAVQRIRKELQALQQRLEKTLSSIDQQYRQEELSMPGRPRFDPELRRWSKVQEEDRRTGQASPEKSAKEPGVQHARAAAALKRVEKLQRQFKEQQDAAGQSAPKLPELEVRHRRSGNVRAENAGEESGGVGRRFEADSASTDLSSESEMNRPAKSRLLRRRPGPDRTELIEGPGGIKKLLDILRIRRLPPPAARALHQVDNFLENKFHKLGNRDQRQELDRLADGLMQFSSTPLWLLDKLPFPDELPVVRDLPLLGDTRSELKQWLKYRARVFFKARPDRSP